MHLQVGAWMNLLRSLNIKNQSNNSLCQFSTRWIPQMYEIKEVVLVMHLLTMNANSKMTWRKYSNGEELLRKQEICLGCISRRAGLCMNFQVKNRSPILVVVF
ncbi:unnamed protein product [Prunus brigantina]